MAGLLSDRERDRWRLKPPPIFAMIPTGTSADALLAAFRKSSGIAAKHLAHALALMKDGRLLDAVWTSMPGYRRSGRLAGVLMNVALLGTDDRSGMRTPCGISTRSATSRRWLPARFSTQTSRRARTSKPLLAYHSGVSGYAPALRRKDREPRRGWCPVDALAGKSGKASSPASSPQVERPDPS